MDITLILVIGLSLFLLIWNVLKTLEYPTKPKVALKVGIADMTLGYGLLNFWNHNYRDSGEVHQLFFWLLFSFYSMLMLIGLKYLMNHFHH